jgi:hypothetical protein
MNVLAPIVRLGQTARVLRLFRRPIWRYSCLHGVRFPVRAGYGISLRPQMVDGYDV